MDILSIGNNGNTLEYGGMYTGLDTTARVMGWRFARFPTNETARLNRRGALLLHFSNPATSPILEEEP
jgi:hypothetical protein